MFGANEEDFRDEFAKMSREELEEVVDGALARVTQLINRTIHLCKFLGLPDSIIQEVLMMGYDDKMFATAMRIYNRTRDDIDFVLIDLGEVGDDNDSSDRTDKVKNSSKNSPRN